MKHYYRIPIPLLLLLIVALFARSTAQDDLIPMPTAESTADLDLTPMFITETPAAETPNMTITAPIITTAPLTLLTPLDSPTTILSWTAHPDAVMYRVILSRQGQTVLRIRVNPSVCMTEICVLDLATENRAILLQAGTRYQWAIVAVTSTGEHRSLGARFRLAQVANPTVFRLFSPITGAIVPEFPVFEWQPLTGATHYRLLFERDGVSYGRFDFNAADCLTDICRLETVFYPFMPPLDFPYTYTWSVLAYTPQGTISSERWSFSIARAEFNPPSSASSASIEPENTIGGSELVVYTDRNSGLRRLNLGIPNTDPGFDRLILERNGDTVLFGFGIIRYPVIRPNTRTIAFVGGLSMEWFGGLATLTSNIWLIDSNGSNPRRFLTSATNVGGSEGRLAWSYDGSKLAADYYDQLYTQTYSIKVYDFSSRNVLLTLENARFPMWSRDNQTLAYFTPDNRILAYNFRTKSIIQLVGAISGGVSYIDWYTGNGRSEFVFSNPYGIWRLFHNTPTGNLFVPLTFSRHPITNPASTYTDFTPVWSPNGNQILIRRQYLDRSDQPIGLGLINADGSGFTEINRTNGYIHNDIWGRDWENTGSFQVVTLTPTGINVKPTATPAASAAVCNQERRAILDHLETNYHFVIVDSPIHWSDSEIQEVCLGVIRTGEALQAFASIVSDPYPSPEAAFKAILLFDPTDTITLKIGGADVGPLNCRTSVASPDQASTATIDCGTDKPLNQYTMVHELGHVFYDINSIPLANVSITDYPCYLPEAPNQSLSYCVERPVRTAPHDSDSLGTSDQFIFGVRGVYYTRTQVEALLVRLNITNVSVDDFSYEQYFLPNDTQYYYLAETDWLRGGRGWGSTAPITGPCDGNASPSFIPTDFQQNPCEIYPWLLRNDPNLGLKKVTEVEEAFADMFINWVYRTLGMTGFANINALGESDIRIISDLNVWITNSFPTTRSGPGDDRFYWMNDLMTRLFAYYNF